MHKLQQTEIKLQAFKVYLSLAKCTSLPAFPPREKVPLSIASKIEPKRYQLSCDEFLQTGWRSATECNGDPRGNRIYIRCLNNERTTLTFANKLVDPSIRGVRFHYKPIVEVKPRFPLGRSRRSLSSR